MVSNDNKKERRFQIFLSNICIYIYSQTGVNDHSEGCERRKIGKESRVWSGVNELMTSRLYIQMEIVERITSIPHCIIQFYRIIQWDIRYLSSRGSIWLRYGPWRHQFTDSAIFSPILLLPRKRKFSRRRRRGRDDTRDTHTHTRKYVRRWVYYLRGTRSPSANLISSTSAGLLSHRSRYSRARARNGNGIDRPHWIMARESG